MINIHATKILYAKLPALANVLDSAGATTGQGDDNPLSGWHANLLTLQRRNCVLLVHDTTRFPLFYRSHAPAWECSPNRSAIQDAGASLVGFPCSA